jgi:hypothetical protein
MPKIIPPKFGEEHCDTCPDCGRGGCLINHPAIGSRGGKKAIKQALYHCKHRKVYANK